MSRGTALRLVPAVVAILLVAGYLVSIPLGVVEPDNRLGTGEGVLAAALLVGFFFAAQTTYTIKGLTVGSGGVAASFERIEARQSALESEVRALQVTLTGLVTKFEVLHLEKLAADGPAIVRYGDIMLGELEHLDAMQFVRPTRAEGLIAVRNDHGSGLDDFDLKQYVEVTQEGQEYLALREQLARQRRPAATGGRRP